MPMITSRQLRQPQPSTMLKYNGLQYPRKDLSANMNLIRNDSELCDRHQVDILERP